MKHGESPLDLHSVARIFVVSETAVVIVEVTVLKSERNPQLPRPYQLLDPVLLDVGLHVFENLESRYPGDDVSLGGALVGPGNDEILQPRPLLTIPIPLPQVADPPLPALIFLNLLAFLGPVPVICGFLEQGGPLLNILNGFRNAMGLWAEGAEDSFYENFRHLVIILRFQVLHYDFGEQAALGGGPFEELEGVDLRFPRIEIIVDDAEYVALVALVHQ